MILKKKVPVTMLSCGTNTTAHRFLSRTSTQNTARYLTDVTAHFKSDKNYDFIHQPTLNSGGPCNTLNKDTNYINNCSYDGAFEMANFLYNGQLIRPQGNEGNLNNLLEFDQSEFIESGTPGMISMDSIGFVYVPTRCAAGALCKLHIAFHGCNTGR